MIKEKYIPLLLAHPIRGITTIDDTRKLPAIKNKEKRNWIINKTKGE